MKTLLKLAVAGVIALSPAAPVLAADFVKGVVKKVDAKKKKITIAHEELKDLDMPAMTMVFRPGDDAMLEQLSPGQKIEFKVDRVNGKLTITELK